MKRIPEAEMMNDAAQAAAYAGADFVQPNTLFVDTFARCFPDFNGCWMIDLGCGPADIPIRFARAYPGLQLVAVDGADAMIALASEAVQHAGMTARVQPVRWRLGREPAPEVAQRSFDAAISNSLLHHMADPRVLWSTILQCVEPAAPVLVMDLERPRDEARARDMVEEHSGDEPAILKHDFFHSLLASYRVEEVRTQLDTAGLPHFKVERLGDRHLVAYGRTGCA